MKIIINNPFRVLGLFSNAKASTINRNLNKLKMFADADQDFPDDLNLASFPSLGTFKRSKTDIEYASSYLNLDHDKMIAALFWFFEGNPITDEPAFDELRASNIQGASDIWSKMGQKEKIKFKEAYIGKVKIVYSKDNVYWNIGSNYQFFLAFNLPKITEEQLLKYCHEMIPSINNQLLFKLLE